MPEHAPYTISRPAPPLVGPRERLAQARYQRCWSQQELADQLGTTPLNISRWERGLTSPNPYFRHKLCALFGLSEVELGLRPDPSLTQSGARGEATPAGSRSMIPSCRCLRRCRWWAAPPCSPNSSASC